MEAKLLLLLVLACSLIELGLCKHTKHEKGRWKLLKRSIGVSAMHMALLPTDRVVTFDRTNFGASNLTLPQAKCTSNFLARSDCYAHSVEFNPANRAVRPLTILTDTWCSSGALDRDGVLVQTGGYRAGERVVRYFRPCDDCDWEEVDNALLVPRWYASNQILPDGRIFVVGGRFRPSYEFIPKTTVSDRVLYQFPFLEETRHSVDIPNNLYPFLHLAPDGNLFVFANHRAVLLDYNKNKVVRKFPIIPGGFSRNYPSTGSSVLLPLKLSASRDSSPEAEVLVCGGALPESNKLANAGTFLPAASTCGRLMITSSKPKWEMEEMPIRRVMGDMILLPTGDVLIINGAANGTAGWGVAREPVLHPVLYKPGSANSSRFRTLSPSTIPRMYHSTAHLLSDGRVLVGGSNTNSNYNFTALFPTELSLEAFSPPYLSSKAPRPEIRHVKPGSKLRYGQEISVHVHVEVKHGGGGIGEVYVTIVAPSFTTHSFAMNQRVLVLALKGVRDLGDGVYVVDGYAPATAALAPPGYYQLFVVHGDVPSQATWVHIM